MPTASTRSRPASAVVSGRGYSRNSNSFGSTRVAAMTGSDMSSGRDHVWSDAAQLVGRIDPGLTLGEDEAAGVHHVGAWLVHAGRGFATLGQTASRFEQAAAHSDHARIRNAQVLASPI